MSTYRMPEKPSPYHSDVPQWVENRAMMCAEHAEWTARHALEKARLDPTLAGHGSFASSGVTPEQRAEQAYQAYIRGFWADEAAEWAAVRRMYSPRNVRQLLANVRAELGSIQHGCRAWHSLREVERQLAAECGEV
jgi:hypothetical protein